MCDSWCVELKRNITTHVRSRANIGRQITSLFCDLMPSGCVAPQPRPCLDRSLITLSGTPENSRQERGLCAAGPVTHGLVRELWPIVTRRPERVGYLLLGMNTIGRGFQDDEGLQILHADHFTKFSNHHRARPPCDRGFCELWTVPSARFAV